MSYNSFAEVSKHLYPKDFIVRVGKDLLGRLQTDNNTAIGDKSEQISCKADTNKNILKVKANTYIIQNFDQHIEDTLIAEGFQVGEFQYLGATIEDYEFELLHKEENYTLIIKEIEKHKEYFISIQPIK